MEERFWFFDCKDDAARRMVGEVAQHCDKHAAANAGPLLGQGRQNGVSQTDFDPCECRLDVTNVG